jgi:hypothetical protein
MAARAHGRRTQFGASEARQPGAWTGSALALGFRALEDAIDGAGSFADTGRPQAAMPCRQSDDPGRDELLPMSPAARSDEGIARLRG